MIRFGLGCVAIIVAAILIASYMAVSTMPPAQVAFLARVLRMAIYSCLAVPVVVLSLILIWLRVRIARRERTYIDGALPLMHRKRRVWRSDIHPLLALWSFVVGEEFFIDPNRAVSFAWSFDAFGRVREVEPAAGWGIQQQYNLAFEQTNAVRAALPGDDVRNTPWGHGSLMPRLPSRALNGRTERPMLPAPEENEIEGTFTPVQVPFGQAVRSNTERSLAIGQSPNGEIVRWDVESAPHIRVHGKTQGSGKTNLIKTVVAGAILQGAHIVVLDRRAFKDWHDYRRYIEMIDTRKEGALLETAKQLQLLYQERDDLLGTHGAPNIAQLPNPPQRFFVVISEFGTTCRNAAETGELDEALPLLKSILSEAGATGVHMIFEDQVVTRAWPRELRGNADPITGYLPEDASNAGGYRFAHALRAHEFHFDGNKFNTWNMSVEAPRLLAGIPGTNNALIDVRSFGRSVKKNNSAQNSPEIIIPTEHRTPNGVSSVENTDLRRMVWSWRDAHPNGTQAELRKCFADDGIEIARGYVHECWHKWPGATGQSNTVAEQIQALGYSLADVRLATGERLGVDVSYRGE